MTSVSLSGAPEAGGTPATRKPLTTRVTRIRVCMLSPLRGAARPAVEPVRAFFTAHRPGVKPRTWRRAAARQRAHAANVRACPALTAPTAPGEYRREEADVMHFGIFVEEMRYGANQVSAFRDAFELAQHAEAWGLDCVWLGEIHFAPMRSVISASLQVASSIATRTRRLRVGTAVTVLPLSHPLRIAEEVATLDHISEGRFEFGIGRSGIARSYDIYGVSYGESQARFREALEIILQAWKGDTFGYAGEFYRFENATVAPRPYQVPHPPLRMAANTEETFPAVGAMGLPLFVGLRAAEIPDLRKYLATYGQGCSEAGYPAPPSVQLRIRVH